MVVKKIVAEVNQILSHSILEYWSSDVTQQEGPKRRIAVATKAKSRHIVVPSAIYSYDSDEALSLMGGEDKTRQRNGHFEEVQETIACISPGCIICLQENSLSHWYLVKKIDLLFARIQVSHCMAPPYPWISQSFVEDETKWISVSRLWFVLVCSRVDSYRGSERYSIFTSPTPDIQQSLSTLKSFSELKLQDELFSIGSDERLRILHYDESNVVVGWEFALNEEKKNRFERQEEYFVVSIRESVDGFVGPWVEVYRGDGKGCCISNLKSKSGYHIRLVKYSILCGNAETATTFIKAYTT